MLNPDYLEENKDSIRPCRQDILLKESGTQRWFCSKTEIGLVVGKHSCRMCRENSSKETEHAGNEEHRSEVLM